MTGITLCCGAGTVPENCVTHIAQIETHEPLILMSAGSLDATVDSQDNELPDQYAEDQVTQVSSDADGDSESKQEPESTWLSKLKSLFSSGDVDKRRTPAGTFDVISREVQLAEPRLLLSGEGFEAFGTLTTESAQSALTKADAKNGQQDPVDENRPPFFLYVDIQEVRDGMTRIGRANGQDPEGAEVAYSIAGGDDADLFHIDETTGELSFRTAPDSDSPSDADGNNEYQVSLRVSDGVLFHDQDVTVKVTGPSAGVSKRIVVPENIVAVGFQADGATADHTYRLSGPDADLFELGGAGSLRFKTAPDFENPAGVSGNNEYHIVRVIDFFDPSRNIVQNITVQVTDVVDEGNNAPLIVDFDDSVLVRENRRFVLEHIDGIDPDGDPVQYAIAGGDDADLFSMDPVTGDLTFNVAPDFENPGDADGNNDYQVTLQISDGVRSQRYELTVTVEDAFVFRRETIEIPENTTVVPVSREERTTGLTGIDGDLFTVDADGSLRFRSAPDFENPSDLNADNQYHVSQIVHPEGEENFVRALTVRVTDVPDESQTSVYTDAVTFTDAPDTTVSGRPVFHWDDAEGVKEYEVFVGRRGETEAVYRTRGLTENEFRVPEFLESGQHTAWLRVHYANGKMSRWGRGHDFIISERPQVTQTGNQLSWTAVDNADRYEIWADHIAADGSLIAEKVVSHTNLTSTSFAVPSDLIGSQLAWWVRAIDDQDGAVERSGWSRPVLTSELEYLESPQEASILVAGVCHNTVLQDCVGQSVVPAVTWDLQAGVMEYEVLITADGESEPLLRERGISGNRLPLPAGYQSNTHTVWIRALGTGLARSRWVEVTELVVQI